MANDANKTLMCAEIFCDSTDSCWALEDQELTKKVCDGLKSARLFEQDEKIPIDFSVTKIKYAYPLLFQGYEKYAGTAKETLSDFTNLHLIGRNGTHSYFDLEECLENVKERLACIIN